MRREQLVAVEAEVRPPIIAVVGLVTSLLFCYF
jgi:hypothetical protein